MKFGNEIQFDKDRYHELEQMISWCRQSIGPGGYLFGDHCVWQIETVFGTSTFTFKRDQDAALFALRWA